jgi:hypothetical protein
MAEGNAAIAKTLLMVKNKEIKTEFIKKGKDAKEAKSPRLEPLSSAMCMGFLPHHFPPDYVFRS